MITMQEVASPVTRLALGSRNEAAVQSCPRGQHTVPLCHPKSTSATSQAAAPCLQEHSSKQAAPTSERYLHGLELQEGNRKSERKKEVD